MARLVRRQPLWLGNMLSEAMRVRELAEPKPPEAPALVLSSKPDLKIYDGLLTVSLAGSGVCA